MNIYLHFLADTCESCLTGYIWKHCLLQTQNVASACYSPLHFGFRRVLFTSAFSSILKMLALIVATEIQLFLNENHVRFPRRVHEADVNIATRHLAIILTEF